MAETDYFAEFNNNLNYENLHYEWIKENPRFIPKRGKIKDKNGNNIYPTYLDEMVNIYNNVSKNINKNKFAFSYFKDDVKWKECEKLNITDAAKKMFGFEKVIEYPFWFVTFNFPPDDELFKKNKNNILKDLEKFIEKDWIVSLKGIFEYHGLKGDNHPHLHLYFSISKYNNKILDKMKESRLAKYCNGFNFIDIKKGKGHHNDYVEGDKDPKKKECLEKDIIWRNENGLPQEISKK